MNKLYKRIVILFITSIFLGGFFIAGYYFILNIFDIEIVVENDKEVIPKEDPVVLDDLEILWVDSFIVENGLFDIVAEINNPNPKWGAENIYYTFSFLNRLEQEVKKIEGVTYILPNESKYILITSVNLLNSVSDIKLTIHEIKWRKLQDFVSLELNIDNIDLKILKDNSRFDTKLTAVIINNSNFGLTDIRIRAVLYDLEGDIVGVNGTSIQSVREDEERVAEMFWTNLIPNQDVSRIIVEAYSNIFANDNFISQHVVEEEARVQRSNLPSKKGGSFYELP